MNKTEFIEAVKMLNEDMEKAISIYGDPETWDVPRIGNIKITKDEDFEIYPNEFEIKFKGFKEVNGNTKIFDLVKLIETKEVYLVYKRDNGIRAYYQYANDNSKPTNFKFLEDVFYGEDSGVGVFNPLKEVFAGDITIDNECCVLPAEDIMIYFSEELFNKEQIIKDIHEALNSFVNATLFDSDDVNSYCDDVLRQYIDEEDFEDYDFDEITEFFKRIYFNKMFPKDQIKQKPISPELLDILEKNINEINSLSIFELEYNTRFYNQVIYNIYNYVNVVEYNNGVKGEEYSWYQFYNVSSRDPEIYFIYK